MKRANHKGAQRGFTILELALVVSFIAIMVVIAIDRMWALRSEAEKASVMQVVGSLRSALGLQMAKKVVEGGIRTIVELEGANPMDMLGVKPSRYIGVVEQESGAQSQPGDWYFVSSSRHLVYRIQYPEDFQSDLAGHPRLRFKIELEFDDNNGNGQRDADERVNGLDLYIVDEFRWKGFAH